LVVAAGLALALGACGDDDGNAVRDIGGTGSASGQGSGSASGTGSGSGSASGLSPGDVTGGTTGDTLIDGAASAYQAYVLTQTDDTIAKSKAMTDAIRAGDLEAAKEAYAPGRSGWERIEPVATLVEELDGKLDARVDDFANEDDPAFTGWHRIEYLLFDKGDVAAAEPFADQLDTDLQTLRTELQNVPMTATAMAVGAAELIEEVSEGKITGEEDRYSGTDLWDFAANVEGSQKVIELLTPALEARDPELLGRIEAGFTEVFAGLAPYKEGDGYKPYSELTEADKTTLKASLAELSEELSQVQGALGLT
jgi:iron uptake system component EfeO